MRTEVEEADSRIFLHAYHAAMEGYKSYDWNRTSVGNIWQRSANPLDPNS